jgi:hypothetical protein
MRYAFMVVLLPAIALVWLLIGGSRRMSGDRVRLQVKQDSPMSGQRSVDPEGLTTKVRLVERVARHDVAIIAAEDETSSGLSDMAQSVSFLETKPSDMTGNAVDEPSPNSRDIKRVPEIFTDYRSLAAAAGIVQQVGSNIVELRNGAYGEFHPTAVEGSDMVFSASDVDVGLSQDGEVTSLTLTGDVSIDLPP